jgi:ribose 5-phosphate isomerase B
MNFYIGSDHAGYDQKKELIELLRKDFPNLNVIDLGPESSDSVEYSRYGINVGCKVAADKNSFGCVICGTGIGISISANKVKGVRAALVYDPEIAKVTRLHNNANIIALGARINDTQRNYEIIKNFLTTDFEGERHLSRLKIIEDYEKGEC